MPYGAVWLTSVG